MPLWYRNTAPKSTAPIPIFIPQVPAHAFTAWTENEYISGVVRSDERLSDVLNARQPIRVENPSIVALGAPRTSRNAPAEAVMDPFDFELVLGRAEDPQLAASRALKRIHKVRYPVVVHGRNFEVRGVLHLFAGNAPEFAAHITSALFLPVTDAIVRRERRVVSDPGTSVVLVNRYAIRTIEQLDTLN